MRCSVLAVSTLLFALMSPGVQAKPANKAVEKAQPMSAGEVAAMYKGRTWLWPDGAGYFKGDRHFYAWSGSGNAATYAVGRWLATKSGQLCFDADWTHSNGSTQKRVCFSHRKSGGVIYQRKDPLGEWYVFRSSPERAGDEYRKVQNGDKVAPNFKKVSANVNKMQAVAEAHRKRIARQRAQERDARNALKEDYALFQAGRYREVLTNLTERSSNGQEGRDASLLRGWTLFKLMQYDKARDQFAKLDKQRSTSESKHGLFYSGVALNPRHLGGW